MQLVYKDKINEQDFLEQPYLSHPTNVFMPFNKMLFHGDNIDVLKFLLEQGYGSTIDLIYIDPPFATKNVFTKGKNRTSTISRSMTDDIAYSDELVGSDYLEFIRLRLILLRELLSKQGSIYLHIDYKIGHYVKVIMDEVFGKENFRNDITRIKSNPKNFNRTAYGNIKDLILFYSKDAKPIWNDPREKLDEADVYKRFSRTDSNGRKYTTIPLHAPGETKNGSTGTMWRGILPPIGRHWRCSPDELEELDKAGLIEWSKTGNPRKIVYAEDVVASGKKIQDVWTFKDKPYPEYPTQKNDELLETIIKASSNEDGFVLDCFCGSGTTLVAAERLNRKWIGIDSSHVAIDVSQHRLHGVMGIFSEDFATYKFE